MSNFPYTLNKNPLPADAFARIVSLADNSVNRFGVQRWFTRTMEASPDCTLFIGDKDGRFRFYDGTDSVSKSVFGMKLAEWRGCLAIELRNGPLPLTFKIMVDNGFNAETGVNDQVSYTLAALVRIHDPSRFFSAVGISLEQPIVRKRQVENLMEQAAVHVLNTSIDDYGNLDPRLLYGLFKRCGLFLMGSPVVHNYRSARVDKLKAAWDDCEKKMAELHEENYRSRIEQERIFIKALPKLVTDLTASGLTPDEIRSTINSLNGHMHNSNSRIRALVDEQLQSLEGQYHQTIARLGNPEVCKPGAKTRSAAGGMHLAGFEVGAGQPGSLSSSAHHAPGLVAGTEPHNVWGQALPQPQHSARTERPKAQSDTNVKSWMKQPSRSFGPHAGENSAQQQPHGNVTRLVCRDCGVAFDYSEGEQAFYQQHGLDTPRRCPACRKARKAVQGQNYHSTHDSSGTPAFHFGVSDE